MRKMHKLARASAKVALLVSMLLLGGCHPHVGVGLSVGVPVGKHGYVSVGTGRWY